MDNQQPLREHLAKHLEGNQTYTHIRKLITGIPYELAGKKPDGLPYSIYRLVEHIRIAQWDMLDFSRNPNYKEIKWPDDYWPKGDAPESPEAWEKSVQTVLSDLDEMIELVKDESRDLLEPFPWGTGQTLMREAMMVAEHNGYHGGQVLVLRRLLGIWD